MSEYTYEVWQGGMMVASATSSDRTKACNEATNYAIQYAKDGPADLIGPDGNARRMGRIRIREGVMATILISAASAFVAGMIMAIPIGMSVNSKASVLWAVPTALIFVAGIITCAVLFFGPGRG